MNVSILKDNPDWRWYLLFGGAFQILTLIGWLGFKCIPVRVTFDGKLRILLTKEKIETWIEHKAHSIQQKLGGRLPRVDVENASKTKKMS
jgi:hypothetical protein